MTSTASSFRAGMRESLPITLGYFPVGISFGIAAVRAGFSAFDAVFLSAVVYAGASQFLILALIGGGAPLIITALSILATNLRHVLYGPAIIDRAGPHASTRKAWAWGFWLSDGAFASAIMGLNKSAANFSERWMFGIGIGPYFSWISGTAAGALFSGIAGGYPAIDAALGFLMPALFLAMVLSFLTPRQIPVVAVTILVTAPLIMFVSSTVGIIAGMVAGAATGMIDWGKKR